MNAPLKLREYKVQLSMQYDEKIGNKGYITNPNTFLHEVYITTSKPEQNIVGDSIPTGTIPISVAHGIKIPIVNITGYFPYQFPSTAFDNFMATLAPYRIVNSVKNIFLAGTILSVEYNGNGLVSELPVGTRWYIKKYTWVRNMAHPDRGEFQLQLFRWFKEV